MRCRRSTYATEMPSDAMLTHVPLGAATRDWSVVTVRCPLIPHSREVDHSRRRITTAPPPRRLPTTLPKDRLPSLKNPEVMHHGRKEHAHRALNLHSCRLIGRQRKVQVKVGLAGLDSDHEIFARIRPTSGNNVPVRQLRHFNIGERPQGNLNTCATWDCPSLVRNRLLEQGRRRLINRRHVIGAGKPARMLTVEYFWRYGYVAPSKEESRVEAKRRKQPIPVLTHAAHLIDGSQIKINIAHPSAHIQTRKTRPTPTRDTALPIHTHRGGEHTSPKRPQRMDARIVTRFKPSSRRRLLDKFTHKSGRA